MMRLTTYSDAGSFLQATQATLEKNEAANNRMLGICLRLRQFPESNKIAPYLATVADGDDLVLAAMMTPPHVLVVHYERPNCEEALTMLADDLLENNWDVPGVLGPPQVAEKFAMIWANAAGAKYKPGMRFRLHELRTVVPPPMTPGTLRLAAETDIELIAHWIWAFSNEALTGSDLAGSRESAAARIAKRDIYLWENAQPVSMAATTRPTTNGIGINLVYTPPALRGRGYASACVAALSQRLLDSGYKFCCLFTDLSNPTSNHIYRTIGYTPVADFNELIFV
jgi:hypothetical protein